MKKLIIFFLFLIALNSYGQQNPQFSQYLFNGVVINPAYAGSREAINVNGLYRKQWAGANGSPTSQTLSLDMPVHYNKIGLGGYLIHDKLGAQFQNAAYVAFAYRVKVSSKGRLALGVSAGINQFGLDGSKLTTDQPNDPSVPNMRTSKTRPDAQVGLYFNTEKVFAGLSLDDIISGKKDQSLTVVKDRRHMYLTSGFVSKISETFKVRPSFLIKEDFKGPTNLDLTAFIIFKDRIWLGSSYRSRLFNKKDLRETTMAKDAVVLMAEIFPIENLRIGYAYDITLTTYKNYTTHEISIGYVFNKKGGGRMLTPRYF